MRKMTPPSLKPWGMRKRCSTLFVMAKLKRTLRERHAAGAKSESTKPGNAKSSEPDNGLKIGEYLKSFRALSNGRMQVPKSWVESCLSQLRLTIEQLLSTSAQSLPERKRPTSRAKSPKPLKIPTSR